LDEAEIRRAFDAFLLSHPNGKLDPKAFEELIGKALPKHDAKKMKSHVFRVYDTNNDNVVDFTEFMCVLIVMMGGTNEDILGKLFRIYDINSDGVISMKEMTKIIHDMYCMLKKDNPKLAAEEFITNTVYAEMDKNKDGKVTMEEYITACLNQDEITNLMTLKMIDIFVE